MNIAELGIEAIPVIVVIVFLAVEAVKATPIDNKWLPVIAGAFGGILGIVAMLVMPEFPATCTSGVQAANKGVISCM